MSRRTPIEGLLEEESGVDTPTRRRSSRIAATVTTRRASASEDTPGKITRSKRLSLSQESSLEKDDDSKTSSQGPLTPPKRIVTRSASKSPSTLSKIEETKTVPAMRTRRRGSSSSIMEEETDKEASTSPILSKMTTRRRSLRSMSTSPTSEVAAGSSKTSTPRKSSRGVSASPTNDIIKSAPPKLKGRRPSVTEKIIPLEAIEETEPKTDEMSATKDSNEIQTPNEEKTDENLPLKKKKAIALKKQNLQTIAEKTTEDGESDTVGDGAKQQETVTEDKLDSSEKEETISVHDKGLKKLSTDVNETPKKSDGVDTIIENVETAEKKALKRESDSPETPTSQSKTTKYSLSLKKRSPGESVEEKELKAVLTVDVEKQTATNSPRRSPRLSVPEVGNRDTAKEPIHTSSDLVNLTGGSEESFHLKLNLSQFDESQENLQKKAEEKSSLPDNGSNTSGSSNTSDKENLHQVQVPENTEIISKKKAVVLIENLNVEKMSSHVEKISSPEKSSNLQKLRGRRSSFYEPMEVEDFPSDYEYSGLEKSDETDKSPIKKLSEQCKSPKTPVGGNKSSSILEMDKSSTEKLKLLKSPLGASPKQGSPTKSSKDMEKLNESLDPITKTTLDLPETEVLKVDVSQTKAHSVTMELPQSISPKRRSARILNQSKSENLEEEQKTLTNSTPNQKSAKRSIGDDLENSMEIGINDTTAAKEEMKSDKEESLTDASKSLNKSVDGELIENSDLQEEEDQNKSIVEIKKKNEATNASNSEVIQMEDEEIAEDSSLKTPQEKDSDNAKNKSKSPKSKPKDQELEEKSNEDDKSKFCENSDSEDIIKKDVSKRDSILKSKSKVEPQRTSNEDEEEAKFSEDSDNEVITKKDQSKRDSTLKRKSTANEYVEESKFSEESDSEDSTKKDESKTSVTSRRTSRGKDSFGEQGKSNGGSNSVELEFVEDSDDGNISKKDLSKRVSILKNKSKGEQQETSNEDDEEPEVSEDADIEVITKKDQSKRYSTVKRKSTANENVEEPKFSENSDSEDSSKKDESKTSVTSRRKSRGKDSFGEQGKSNGGSNSEELEFVEDSNSGNVSKKDLSKRVSILKNKSKVAQQETSNEDDEEPKFSEDSDTEVVTKKDESKRDSTVKKKSTANENVEEPKFSEESSDDGSADDFFIKNQSKRDSTSRNKQKSKDQRKINSDEDQLATFFEDCDDDDDIKAPFLLYTVKPKKSVDSKSPTKSTTSEDNEKSANKDKGKKRTSITPQTPSVVVNSASDTEKDVSDLDAKINSLLANQLEEDSSSSYESVTHFLDDLAEEGEEDTPSEGSNDIIEMGESIGSTESEIDSDETYENDSFIDDDAEIDLLSGEEYDLGVEKKKKRKHSRIITVSDSEEENKENELTAANKVDVKQPEVIIESKEKVINGIEEDSDIEKMSTRPYCGLTPPSIISLRDSLSDNDKIEPKDKQKSTSNVLINKEDNLQSLEELKQHDISTEVQKASVDKRKISLQLTPKATFTPNNSMLEDVSVESDKIARKRHSSLTIHENINLQDMAGRSVGDRISQVVDVFCSSVKKDEKDRCGNISLNISLEFVKSPSEINLEEKQDKPVEKTVVAVLKKRSLSEPSIESKSKMEKDLRKKWKQRERENEESIEKSVEKVLKKRLSSELNEPRPKSEEQIKLSAKKRKSTKKDDVTLEDQVSTKKRSPKQRLQKASLENQNETNDSKDWELLSDDASNNKQLSSKKKLSKKDRKKKKNQKNVSLTKTVDNEEKTEEEGAEKQWNIPEMNASDSDMSEDLDAELNDKYNTSEELNETQAEAELEIIPKVQKSKKKSAKKQLEPVDDSGMAVNELVKKVKKRKRDKSEDLADLYQEHQERKTVLKTKKQKDQSKPKTQNESESTPFKKSKKPITPSISDEIFLAESKQTKKKSKKTPTMEVEPKHVVDEASGLKKKKKKVKNVIAAPSSSILFDEQEESKFQYFPSRILNTLTKNEKPKKIEDMPGASKQPKKPKLLPSSTMTKRAWETIVVDSPLLPSKTSSKKMKMDPESFNKKDFKNLMLYDPSRVQRMDSKHLLKKKQKMKF